MGAVQSRAIVLFAMIGCVTVSASASSWDFEDMIDTWTPLGIDSIPVFQGHPLTYTHDLNQEVDFGGEQVTEAWLELDFTNDWSDDYGSICILFWKKQWDYREHVLLQLDETGWTYVDEVDNDQEHMLLDVGWINDDGMLDVEVKVWNKLGTATAYLDHSRVYGNTASPAPPVPEPLTFAAFGAAILAAGRYARRRRDA